MVPSGHSAAAAPVRDTDTVDPSPLKDILPRFPEKTPLSGSGSGPLPLGGPSCETPQAHTKVARSAKDNILFLIDLAFFSDVRLDEIHHEIKVLVAGVNLVLIESLIDFYYVPLAEYLNAFDMAE